MLTERTVLRRLPRFRETENSNQIQHYESASASGLWDPSGTLVEPVHNPANPVVLHRAPPRLWCFPRGMRFLRALERSIRGSCPETAVPIKAGSAGSLKRTPLSRCSVQDTSLSSQHDSASPLHVPTRGLRPPIWGQKKTASKDAVFKFT